MTAGPTPSAGSPFRRPAAPPSAVPPSRRDTIPATASPRAVVSEAPAPPKVAAWRRFKQRHPRVFWTLVVVAGLYLVGAVLPQSRSSAPSTATESRDWWVGPYVDCQEQVKTRLKAPSTASFVTIPEVRYNPGGSEAYILGHVDAQNSFGAMLRQRFGCHLVKNASAWTVEGVAME